MKKMKKLVSAIVALAMSASLFTAIASAATKEYSFEETYDSTEVFTVTGGETYLTFSDETVVTEGQWNASFDFMTDVADGSHIAWRNTFVDTANSRVQGAWVYTEGTSGLHVKAGDWNGSYQSALAKNTWYTCKVTIDYDDTESGYNARWYIYNKSTGDKICENWWNATTGIAKMFIQDEKGTGKCYLDNVSVTATVEEPTTAITVTGGESYIEFPADTVVTEGVWNGSFDFMTDVADGSSVAWRNTFMMGANNAGGTKVIGAWVYTEGTSGLHVKAGDWNGSYQCALTKGTWYTCKVVIDYDDTESGANARWYIYERDTNTLKAEYWWNATTAIDRLLYQDERNSGKCYIDNVEVSVEAPEVPEGPAPYEDQEYKFDDATLPSGWAAGTGDGYSITDGQLVLAGTPNWGVDVTFDPNLRESGKYIIGWDYTTQATSFGDYGLFLKLLDSADMSQVKEVFSHMGDGQIHLGNQVFWNITTPTSRMELEVNVDTKEWQLYVDGVAVTNAGESGVGTWTESLAIGFMNYQHGTCKIDNVTVTRVTEQDPEDPEEPEVPTTEYSFEENFDDAGVFTVTGGESYVEFPQETVVTEGVWNGSFDFMTDVADGSNVAWRNTFMNGYNHEGGTKVIGAWVYTEGTSGLHVKAGDWNGSYQGALAKGTWYTCKVTINYDDTESGSNARWYIYERDTDTLKAEYWWNTTTAIDKLLVQDERGSGKCYVDNIKVWGDTKPSTGGEEGGETDAPTGVIRENNFDDGNRGSWSSGEVVDNALKVTNYTDSTLNLGKLTAGTIISSFDFAFKDITEASTPRLRLAWVGEGGIDSGDRTGYWVNISDDSFTLQNTANWGNSESLPLNGEYTVTAKIDLDKNTSEISVTKKGETTVLASFTGGFACDLTAFTVFSHGSDGYVLIDNFVAKYEEDTPAIKYVKYTSSDETTTLTTSAIASVEPDVEGIAVELTAVPADYQIKEYIKLTDSSDSEVAYSYEISGNSIVIIPDDMLGQGTTYKLTISKDLYSASGYQLGYNASYSFKTNAGSLKGSLVSITNGSGEALTNADDFLAASSFNINYKITNTTGDACEIAILRVYYNAAGYAVKVVPEYLTFAADKTSIEDKVSANTDSVAGAETVGIFLWNDFDKYVPLCENILLQ